MNVTKSHLPGNTGNISHLISLNFSPTRKHHKHTPSKRIQTNTPYAQTLERTQLDINVSNADPDHPIELSPEVGQVDVILPPSQLQLITRLLQVGLSAIQFLSIYTINQLNSPGNNERAAQALQSLLPRLGPTFVKLAQSLSMRPDLVGETYANALAELQDNVPPFSNDTAFAILEQELGRKIEDVFSFLSPNPVASASLGQVYKGVLRPELGGTTVAVKVQRPGAVESITLDIYLLRTLIGWAQSVAGITRDLRGLADEVGTGLRGECDFRNEVANATQFARAHANLPFITTPKIVMELCSRSVLVSEWVDGKNPTQLLSLQGDGNGRAAVGADVLSLVKMGIQCSLSQLLVTGVMHGDPHSGNLLLTTDGRLCYLDFGLLVRVPSHHQQAMMSALVHLGLGEWSRLVDDLGRLDLLKPNTDRKQLALELEKEFKAVLSNEQQNKQENNNNTTKTSTNTNNTTDNNIEQEEDSLSKQLPLLSLQTSSLSFTSLAGVLFRVAFKFKFLLPTYFPLVIRSVASLEGIALAVDPDFKLVAAGMPVVLNQLLSDRRPAAQELLKELLLAPGGALRTDDTTRQILQVWLSAAQQAARADALSSGKALPPDVEYDDTTTNNNISSAAVDMTSLLLDRRNVSLRRTLALSNPAATIAQMPKEMRGELLQILRLAVNEDGGMTAATGLLESSPTARAQRKRLWMLFKASVPKVMRSPPKSIAELILFSAAVCVALVRAMIRKVWRKVMFRVRRWWLALMVMMKRREGKGGESGGVASSAV